MSDTLPSSASLHLGSSSPPRYFIPLPGPSFPSRILRLCRPRRPGCCTCPSRTTCCRAWRRCGPRRSVSARSASFVRPFHRCDLLPHVCLALAVPAFVPPPDSFEVLSRRRCFTAPPCLRAPGHHGAEEGRGATSAGLSPSKYVCARPTPRCNCRSLFIRRHLEHLCQRSSLRLAAL